MDRYQLFHRIAVASDLSSIASVLRHAVAELIIAVNAERGVYFAAGPGGLRPMAALNQSGADIAQPHKQFPTEIIQRVLTSGKPLRGDMPRLMTEPGSTGRGAIMRFMAVPARADRQVVGVAYLERRYQQPGFQQEELDLAEQTLQDIQNLLNSSRDYEKKSFELDTIKSRMAMSQVHLVSQHPSMLNLFRFIQKLAKVPSTVLIHGESGTGKELVARAIYELGEYQGPFISMNCGAIEPSLLKAELFGSLKGSYTGAHKDRPGLFKKAENGVLFMDEIGDMPADMQVALLRTLECGEIMPVGGDTPQRVNTRVVAATHRNLREMAAKGDFRNDLYQRLKGLTLEVPPLRDRRSDIPHLCRHFIKKYNERLGLHFKGVSTEALELLSSLDYAAGNVRELEHTIERAMVFEDHDEVIGADHLLMDDAPIPAAETGIEPISPGGPTFEDRMNRYAVRVLEEAIRACGGNKTKAMKRLGLSRSTFYGMLHRHGLATQGEAS